MIRPPTSRLRESQAWRSIFRAPHTDTPRGRAATTFQSLFLHVYPAKIPRRILSFRSTFRLGFIAAVLFAMLLVSGIYLMFFYVPSITSAYLNMHELRTAVTFGQFVRNIHRWSAHLMVLVAFLHMLRVFYAGAYKAPRQFNWVVGIGLLLATLGLSFTGYLLPWDQLAFWAVTVGTNVAGYAPFMGENARRALLGAPEVGEKALLRFYVFHIYVLPTVLVTLLGVHIWRVRKDGLAGEAGQPVSAPPTAEPQEVTGGGDA